jgi:hypothetical protein
MGFLVSAAGAFAAGAVPGFAEHTIATQLKGGYQVVVADLNRDGKPDLIALASGLPELVWYENPTWKRHVIAGDLPRLINCVYFEANGKRGIVVANGFSNEARNSPGTVWLLEPAVDVNAAWSKREIDRLPTSHRLRLARIDGGSPVIVNAPLTAATAAGPDYRGHPPLVYYRPGEWQRTLITAENEGVMHGLYVVDWDGDGRDEILTASFSGLHLNRRAGDGKWTREEISRGSPEAWPKSGASDVAVGRLVGRRFLCSIEPWHGNQVAVYLEEQGAWVRNVIDDTLVDGHTIATADFSGDGREAIVVGQRGGGGALVFYTATDASGRRWERHAIDLGGMTAAACAITDLNGDGRPDVVAIGSGTANLKWYEQQ